MSQISLDNTGFIQLWKTFYDQALKVASASVKKTDTGAHQNQVLTLLDAMTKLIFGLDESKKSIAVTYGIGSIELAIKLLFSTSVLSKMEKSSSKTTAAEAAASVSTDDGSAEIKLLTSGLKTIKCCVVRNKIGRSRCRSAGVFNFVSLVLEHTTAATEDDDKKRTKTIAPLVEEASTTLAAICLGDDLNALQGSIQMQKFVDVASSKFPQKEYATLHQKLTYLVALFDAIQKENVDLVSFIEKEQNDFFDIVSSAEISFCDGLNCCRKDGNDGKTLKEAIANYNKALEKIQPLVKKTSLLDNLVCQIYEQRSKALMTLKDWQGSLDDTDILISKENNFNLPSDVVGRIQIQRSELFKNLDRINDAKKALNLAMISDPQLQCDEDIKLKLQELNISK